MNTLLSAIFKLLFLFIYFLIQTMN